MKMMLKEYESKRAEIWNRVDLEVDNKKKIELIKELIIFDYKVYKDGLIDRKNMAIGVTGAILYIFNTLEGDPGIAEDVKFLEEKIFEYSGTLELPNEYIEDVELEKKGLDRGISELKDQLSKQGK